MTNTQRAKHLPLLRHGATLFQISSHQRDFDMAGFGAAATSKRRLARGDGLPQRSYTYVFKNVPAAPAPRQPNEAFRRFGDGPLANAAGEKEVHFIADGWTVNHNGAAKGSPLAVVAQELDMIAEQVFAVAQRRPPAATGKLPFKSAQSGSVYRTNNYPFRDGDGTVRNELLPNQLRKLLDAHERVSTEEGGR